MVYKEQWFWMVAQFLALNVSMKFHTRYRSVGSYFNNLISVLINVKIRTDWKFRNTGIFSQKLGCILSKDYCKYIIVRVKED